MIDQTGFVVVLGAAAITLAGSALNRPPRRLHPEAPARRFVIGRARLLERWFPSLHTIGDRELAVVLAFSTVGAVMVPPVLFLGPIAIAAEAVRRQRSRTQAHHAALVAALPDTIDQLGLAVGAGLTLPAALRLAHRWLPPPTAPLVDDALARLDAGAPLSEALAHIGRELPNAARRPITVIVAATRDGAPLGPSLARAADEARRARRRDAEVRARRLPVLMLLPLVLCVLPAFVLLTLVPLIVGSLDGLSIADGFPVP